MPCSATTEGRKVTPALRGVIAEIATSGVLRSVALCGSLVPLAGASIHACQSGVARAARAAAPLRAAAPAAHFPAAHSILASMQSTLGPKSYTSFVQCICRYPWKLVQALMGDLMEQVLLDFEAEAHVEVRQLYLHIFYRPLSI